jgi:prepilin-type N-terminal cleavage/methylation domain-containing protein/prepilin-type processing-associated H-X9-DG protein
MKRTMTPAFTLPELMVVIAVIGLLVAMMLPSFTQVIKVARQSQCAGNLEHLGQAFSTVGANVSISGTAALRTNGWVGQISSYVGGDKAVMICPEGADKSVSSVESLDQILAQYSLRTYGDTAGNNFLYDMPLGEGPCCIKANVSGDGFSYDLSFEDQRTSNGQQEASYSDHSYGNPIISVAYDGVAVTITVKGGGGGYRWDLVDADKNILLISVMKISMPGRSCKLTGDGGAALGALLSYGLNSVAPSIKPSDSRIMALDYPTAIARVAGIDETRDNWLKWTDTEGRYTFARHMNRCNVLLGDGRVVRFSPEQIDPTNPIFLSQYWKP